MFKILELGRSVERLDVRGPLERHGAPTHRVDPTWPHRQPVQARCRPCSSWRECQAGTEGDVKRLPKRRQGGTEGVCRLGPELTQRAGSGARTRTENLAVNSGYVSRPLSSAEVRLSTKWKPQSSPRAAILRQSSPGLLYKIGATSAARQGACQVVASHPYMRLRSGVRSSSLARWPNVGVITRVEFGMCSVSHGWRCPAGPPLSADRWESKECPTSTSSRSTRLSRLMQRR